MSLEEIYGDLEAIAKHVGPLNEDAVQSATTILARPRYAASSNPATLLVEDLKRVIDAIPNYPVPKPQADVEWASHKFQNYARRYFSLDAAGQGFTHRRTFGREERGGSVGAWMTRGVLYRVAAGLFELWTDLDTGDSSFQETRGYHIERVRVTTTIGDGALASKSNVLEYDLRLTVPGPHILPTPLPAYATRIVDVSAGNADVALTAKLIPVHRIPFSRMIWAGSTTAIVFGPRLPAGEQLSIRVKHRDEICTFMGPWWVEALAWYRIDQPVSRLELAVDVYAADNYKWFVTDSEAQSAPVSSNRWSWDKPTIDVVYALRGHRLSRAERRRNQREAVHPGDTLDKITNESV